MFDFFDKPGLLYVVATLIPLLSFFVILTVGGLKNLARTYKESGWGSSLYWFLGGDQPGRAGAYLAVGAISLSCVLSIVGLVRFLGEFPVTGHEHEAAAHVAHDEHAAPAAAHDHKSKPKHKMTAWAGKISWASLIAADDDDTPAARLEVGYYIDHFGAVMFAMVAL